MIYTEVEKAKENAWGNLFLKPSKQGSYPTAEEMGRNGTVGFRPLLLDGVLAAEHVINLGEVVDTLLQSLDTAGRLEVLLQVGVLAELAHVIVGLGSQDGAGLQTVLKIQLLNHLRDITNDLGTEHGRSQTTAVGEESDALALAGRESDVAQETGQAGVDGSGVHVTAKSGNLETGLHTLGKALLGKTHEGLLNGLVGQGGSVVEIAQLGGNLGEGRVGGVGQEVVVEHTAIGLLDQLAGRGVVKDVVKAIQSGLGLVRNTVGAVLVGLEDLLASIVGLVAGVDGLGIAAERVLAINNGVFAGEVGLVEVIGVGEVGATETGLEDNRGIGANQHGNAASTTGGAGSTLGVQGNITADNDGVAAVPGGRLEPVDAVEDGIGATVAGVDGVNTLDIGVAGRSEELHQNGLDGLRLVQECLGADLKAADGLGVDVVLLHEGGEGGERHGVDIYSREQNVSQKSLVRFPLLVPLAVHTLTVITEAHLGLAETNGVLARANAIVLLQLGLVDTLQRRKSKSVFKVSQGQLTRNHSPE